MVHPGRREGHRTWGAADRNREIARDAAALHLEGPILQRCEGVTGDGLDQTPDSYDQMQPSLVKTQAVNAEGSGIAKQAPAGDIGCRNH